MFLKFFKVAFKKYLFGLEYIVVIDLSIHDVQWHILRNTLLPYSGPPPPTLSYHGPDVDANKNYKIIIDLGPFMGSGWGYD